MRRRKKASPPGTPPSVHKAAGLKVINYDVRYPASIIGPRKFKGSRFFNQTVPRVHEFGGMIRGRRWAPLVRQRGVFARARGIGRARYPERSFMWSAVKSLQAKNKIAPEFSVSLRRTW